MSTTSSAQPLAPPARRKTRWLRYLLVLVLLFVLVPAGHYLYLRWSLHSELAAAMAETDQLDPGWRLENIEAARKSYPPEEDSAPHIIKVTRLLGRASPSHHRDYEVVFERLPATARLNAQQIAMIAEAFAKVPEGVAEARKLKDMPAGRMPLKYSPDFICTLLPNHQDARVVMDVLRHDAMWRAHQGDPDAAIESCLALLNAARVFGDEPTLISLLIRCAGHSLLVAAVERTLAQGFPGEAALEEMQQRLPREAADLRTHFVNAARGERAGLHELFLVLGRSETTIPFSTYAARMGPNPTQTAMEWLRDRFPILYRKDYPAHLRHMNELVKAAQLPLDEQLERFRALEEAKKQKGIFAMSLAPSMEKCCMAHLRSQAGIGALQAALACERFRIAQGRWPEALAELVQARLLDAVPTDPYANQPLRFSRTKEGLVIYGLGEDLEDNGGNIDREKTLQRGMDYGIRLWDPARRRQPPLPPVALER
jgi:hypothetical protein